MGNIQNIIATCLLDKITPGRDDHRVILGKKLFDSLPIELDKMKEMGWLSLLNLFFFVFCQCMPNQIFNIFFFELGFEEGQGLIEEAKND